MQYNWLNISYPYTINIDIYPHDKLTIIFNLNILSNFYKDDKVENIVKL